jgi:hypothetical protein
MYLATLHAPRRPRPEAAERSAKDAEGAAPIDRQSSLDMLQAYRLDAMMGRSLAVGSLSLAGFAQSRERQTE